MSTSLDESEDDFYLSDIHVENESSHVENQNESNFRMTRIEYALPDDYDSDKHTSNEEVLKYDADGDIIVERRSNRNVLLIEHSMHTTLDMVGLQIWRASLFLSDFILDNPQVIKNKIVVEFGAGVGITGIFCSLYAKWVFCTDLEQIVLKAHRNWDLNKPIVNNSTKNISFKCLDWADHNNFFKAPLSALGELALNEQDLEMLKYSTVFLAADVIYDNLITVKFMNTVYAFMVYGIKQPKVCYVANETRVNFNTETLSSTDTAFSFFKECLQDLNDYVDEENGYKFKTEQVNCEKIPFYILNYKRNPYLSIWKLECIPI